jgi:ABC-type nitrate/sulfonate/bicarbonate transport system permease component
MRALFVILQAMLGLAVIALAWMAAAALIHDPNKLPRFEAVLNRTLQLATSDDYRQHLNASTSVLLFGLLPAIVGGVLFGWLAGISTVFRWLLGPIVITLGAAPLIALMPMLLQWLGLGPNLTTMAVAIITVFAVANAVMISLGTRQGSLSLAIVRGLRWGVVLGALALVICEMLTARLGVATYIMNAGAQFETTNVGAGIVLLFVPVIAVAAILQAIEEQLAG